MRRGVGLLRGGFVFGSGFELRTPCIAPRGRISPVRDVHSGATPTRNSKPEPTTESCSAPFASVWVRPRVLAPGFAPSRRAGPWADGPPVAILACRARTGQRVGAMRRRRLPRAARSTRCSRPRADDRGPHPRPPRGPCERVSHRRELRRVAVRVRQAADVHEPVWLRHGPAARRERVPPVECAEARIDGRQAGEGRIRHGADQAHRRGRVARPGVDRAVRRIEARRGPAESRAWPHACHRRGAREEPRAPPRGRGQGMRQDRRQRIEHAREHHVGPTRSARARCRLMRVVVRRPCIAARPVRSRCGRCPRAAARARARANPCQRRARPPLRSIMSRLSARKSSRARGRPRTTRASGGPSSVGRDACRGEVAGGASLHRQCHRHVVTAHRADAARPIDDSSVVTASRKHQQRAHSRPTGATARDMQARSSARATPAASRASTRTDRHADEHVPAATAPCSAIGAAPWRAIR